MTSPRQFRAGFPALTRLAWFDTPSVPPGHVRVTQAMEKALRTWADGSFSWAEWDLATESVRERFAQLTGSSADDVAVMHSVSEFMATVAQSEPDARVVMLADEFRSVRYPFDGDDQAARVRFIDRSPGESRTEALLRGLTGAVDYVIASEVLASDGDRLDVAEIVARARALGAFVVIDASQALGALGVLLPLPDAYVCHTYKWMIAPRGITVAHVAPRLRHRLRPIAPGWKSTVRPHGFYGGPFAAPATAQKLDATPSWLSMIGGVAALDVMLELDPARVETHALALAEAFRSYVRSRSGVVLREGRPSHIVALEGANDGLVEAFRDRDIRCAVGDGFLRVGFHYFNSDEDLARLVAAVDSVPGTRDVS